MWRRIKVETKGQKKIQKNPAPLINYLTGIKIDTNPGLAYIILL